MTSETRTERTDPAPETTPPAFVPPPPTPNDTLVSPEVSVDGRVTLRLYAPHAGSVSVRSEMLAQGQTLDLARDGEGVWAGTTGAIAPGTYRYVFVVDGVSTVDPKNVQACAGLRSVMSLLRVTGSGSTFEDTLPVPHGAVAAITYFSVTLGTHRRMHVYTPPGYGRSSDTYPALYLLHGGGDADGSWSTVGRAGFILDNLIAEGRAKPMVMVMPAGHAPGADGRPGTSPAMGPDPAGDPFTGDLLQDIIPYVERTYRISARPTDRALAGLSMGGVQTANIGLVHADLFPYIGIFSSGWFPEVRAEFERLHGADLDADRTKLKLLWVAYGRTDIANANSKAMLEMFDRHGLAYTASETDGGHTWFNWRHYLADLAPLLFR
jgi:enterochelin esterase-like enzyme